MNDDPLNRHLDGLFSDDIPEPDHPVLRPPKPESSAGLGPSREPSSVEPQMPVEPRTEVELPPEVEPPTAPEIPLRDGGMLSLEAGPEPERRARMRPASPRQAKVREAVDWIALQEQDLERGRERILNLLLGGVVVGGAAAMVAMIIATILKPSRFTGYIPYLAGYGVLVLIFFWRGLSVRWRASVLFAIAYGVAGLSIYMNGPMSTGPWYLFALSLFFFVLVGPRAGVISSIVHTVFYIGLATAYRLSLLQILVPIDLHDNSAQFMVVSATFALMAIVMTLVPWLYTRAQNQITRRMRDQYQSLQEAQSLSRTREQELAAANRILQRQTAHFELGARVGYLSTRTVDAGAFVHRVVSLVREQLDLYDVSLYLLDPTREILVFQAADHQEVIGVPRRETRLRVADNETLARCVETGEACIASHHDQLIEAEFALPQTCSMLVLPLVAQEKTIGVVAIQSLQDDAFKQSDVVPLRTFADQVAVAISYDRALVEVQERLREVEALQQYYVREAWQQFLPTQERDLFQFTQPGIDPLDEQMIDQFVTQTAGADGAVSEVQDLMVPLSQRGQVIGLLGLLAGQESVPLDEGQVSLVRAVSEQMELILDNARLFEEARLRAGQERKVRDVATRMRETLDVESVLRTAADELYRALNLDELAIRLTPPEYLGDEEGQ